MDRNCEQVSIGLALTIRQMAYEVITSQNRSSFLGICVLKVVEDALEEQECASRKEGRHEDRSNPVNADGSGSSETDYTNRQEESSNHGKWQSSLRRQLVVRLANLGNGHVFVVDSEADVGGDTTDDKTKVGETVLSKVEAVDLDEDELERLNPDVEDGIL